MSVRFTHRPLSYNPLCLDLDLCHQRATGKVRAELLEAFSKGFKRQAWNFHLCKYRSRNIALIKNTNNNKIKQMVTTYYQQLEVLALSED